MSGPAVPGRTWAAESLPWRSLLYVPVTVERFVRKAATVGADAVQLDLEDSIAPMHKARARQALPAAVEQVASAGVDVVVRVNRPLRALVADLDAAARPGVRAIAVPKVDSAALVRLVDEALTELETERSLPTGSIGVIGMIESAAGLFQVQQIAQASTRLVALTLGTEDFAWSVGSYPEPQLMLGPTQQVVLAARAAGLWPLGLAGSLAGFDDLAALARMARLSRRLGCVGASVIHPAQVPVVNEAFMPPVDEVDAARRLLAAYEAALASGQGAVAVDGRMVDEPVARRARALVRTQEQYRLRDEQRQN